MAYPSLARFSSSSSSPPPTLRRLQQYALFLSALSVLYCTAEGAVSIALGAEAASRALVFFGIQSAIEVASACIVLWRFRKVAKPGEERAMEVRAGDLRVEKIGTWSIGILIALLALAAEASAIAALAQHSEPDTSNAELIVSASALVCMVLLWLPKRYLAKALDSSTMAGEATCSLSCIQITLVLFTGALIFRLWRGGWWVDSATTLALGLLFAREAYKMLAWVSNPAFDGGCCGGCHKHVGEGAGAAVGVVVVDGAGETDVDAKLELAEQYRDLCVCCFEKDACREADECKCDSASESSSEQEPCCVPRNPAGEKCCTRETIKGARPTTVVTTAAATARERTPSPSPPAYDAACAKGCCGGAVDLKPSPSSKPAPAPAAPVQKVQKAEVKIDACCAQDENASGSGSGSASPSPAPAKVPGAPIVVAVAASKGSCNSGCCK